MPGDTSASGLFNKLTKRYSNVKFLRNSPGRQGSPQPISTGSYDMSGHDSCDLKREIGAPILISKTRIDTDTTDCCIPAEQYVTDMLPTTVTELIAPPVTMDEIKFTFHTPNAQPILNQPLAATPSPTIDYDTPKPNGLLTTLRKNRSKSANNLHKSEMKVFLQKAPSLELEQNNNTPLTSRENGTFDVPRQLQYKEVTPAQPRTTELTHGSLSSVQNVSADSLSEMFHSKDSLNKESPRRIANSRDSLQPPSLHHRHNDDSSGVEDFDLKSASFQSLDARNLFLSIEELNEITRQINESEDYGGTHEIDLEYCEHRDRLKPDQRRITLLRNRNKHTGPLNFDRKKEKLTNAWTGLKHWIGEEKGKLKGAIHKHAAAQRVGGNAIGDKNGSMVRNQEFFEHVQRRNRQPELRVSMAASDDPSHASSTNISNGIDLQADTSDDERHYSAVTSDRVRVTDDSDDRRTQSRINGSEDREPSAGTVPAFKQALVRKGSKTTAAGTSNLPTGRVGEHWEVIKNVF